MCSVKDMDGLKKLIRKRFINFLENLVDSKLWAGQLDINSIVEDLFYNNGVDFIKSRLVQ